MHSFWFLFTLYILLCVGHCPPTVCFFRSELNSTVTLSYQGYNIHVFLSVGKASKKVDIHSIISQKFTQKFQLQRGYTPNGSSFWYSGGGVSLHDMDLKYSSFVSHAGIYSGIFSLPDTERFVPAWTIISKAVTKLFYYLLRTILDFKCN